MRKSSAVALLALALGFPALAGTFTNEVLVLSSGAVRVDSGLSSRRGIEIQNLGPNSIFCAVGASSDAVLNKARKIEAGGSWGVALQNNEPVYCIAATANQVTGAATVVTEVR